MTKQEGILIMVRAASRAGLNFSSKTIQGLADDIAKIWAMLCMDERLEIRGVFVIEDGRPVGFQQK